MKATFIRSRFFPRLPSAGVGALLALLICGIRSLIDALIGIILLIGIVKKNAIMMIDFALEAEREEGLRRKSQSTRHACLRFRPNYDDDDGGVARRFAAGIARHGTGSELRRPLGISIVGGLLLSQFLTLYTTPVIYLYLDRLAARFRRQKPAYVSRQPKQAAPGLIAASNAARHHEYFRAIHSPSRSDLAAGDRTFFGGIVAYRYMAVAPVPGWISRHSRFGHLPGADPATVASSLRRHWRNGSAKSRVFRK